MNRLNDLLFSFFQSLFRWLQLFRITRYTKVYDNGCAFQGKPKLLILGSSFAKTNIIPKTIALCNEGYGEHEIFNFGQSMAGPYEDYISVVRNLDKLQSLEYVFIGIDPHILSKKFYHYMDVERNFVTLKEWRYMFDHHKSYMQKYHPNITISWSTPFLYLKNIFRFKCKKTSRFMGYEPRNHFKVEPFNPQDIKKYTYEPLELFGVSDFSIKYLQKLQKLLQKKTNAKITYFLSPSYDWQEGYAQYCREYDTVLIHKLQKALGDIPIIGTLYKEDYDLKKYDFYDNRHLSHTGALKYTTKLFSDIKQQSFQNMQILPLYHYRADKIHAKVQDTLVKNLEVLQDEIYRFTRNKKSIVLHGVTNVSRIIVALLHEKNICFTLSDTSSFLKTLPQFIQDGFCYDKAVLHVNSLPNFEYDGIVIANFFAYEKERATLLTAGVEDMKLMRYSGDINYEYLNMQINMLFSIFDYLLQNFEEFCIVGNSILFGLVREVLSKNAKTSAVLDAESLQKCRFGDIERQRVYIVLEAYSEVSAKLQEEGVVFEHIVSFIL